MSGMAPYVEANSLSDITQLASNPPKYPRNPTEKKRDPLTLYIARVPGSRDIILTTLKPQLKNVTAEDVASSLYYLHLNSDEDTRLLEQDSDVIVEEEEPNEAKQKPLPRKPLPESTRSSLDLNRQPSSIPDPLPRSGPQREITRKALPTEGQATTRDHGKEQVQRKPLGPRPLLSEPSIQRKPLEGIENQPLTSRPGGEEAITSNSGVGEVEHSNSIIPKEDNVDHSRGVTRTFSITIIRRDPSSGAQWNIGSVHGEAQPKLSNSKKPYFNISVHLSTPGYTRFKDSQPALNSGYGNSGIENSSSATDTRKDLHPIIEPGFDRQIRMEGTSFWNRSKQHKRSQSDASEIRNTARGRSDSLSPGGIPEDDTQLTETKGYTFGSPWGGRCKFATSSSGRTLRCKHTLPGPISATNTTESGTYSRAAVVSELRFNLPSLIKFQANNSASAVKGQVADFGRFHIPKFDHIRNKLSPEKLSRPPLPTRPHPSSYASMYPSDDEDRPPLPPRPVQNSYVTESSDEDEGRLDLSIGQEKAGGGNRGKRAKLGKLIILDEGFKMLDLVVAANMGVWWSVWESNTS